MKNKIHQTKQKEIEVYKKIETYISGNLSQFEIEELWEILINNPDLMNQLETALNVRSLAKNHRGKI
ncbi:hypothetical protein [Rhodohalobacter halophilus]|uniref:hypothetical protein n=1 Tax=Rhodohalobacter halophilus TaxID=1812810 RepID=UPI00083F7FC7|nr:hypothetical protein [Rhodohalobacter halophilus]